MVGVGITLSRRTKSFRQLSAVIQHRRLFVFFQEFSSSFEQCSRVESIAQTRNHSRERLTLLTKHLRYYSLALTWVCAMSASPSVFSDEASRKRMRKGTHSCMECRRRKKSCVTNPNGQKCVECTERGVQCISQDTRPPKRPRVENKQSLQERIVTLETTVHTIVDRLGIDDGAGAVRSVDLLHSLCARTYIGWRQGATTAFPDGGGAATSYGAGC